MTSSDIALPDNRKFGLFFVAVFLAAGAYAFSIGALGYACLSGALAAVLLAVALAKPDLLLPLNELWMRLGLLLGAIVGPIVLGAVFFGLFTPLGLTMKLFGRDELRLKATPRRSLWKDADPAPCVFTRQF